MKKLMTGNEALVQGAWEAVYWWLLHIQAPLPQKSLKTCLQGRKFTPNGHPMKR